MRSVNSGAGAVPPNHVRPVLWRPGATSEQAPQRSLWSPRPPTWAAPSPGLTSEEHRRAASVRIPHCPDIRSRQATPPVLSARAPQHRAAENQPPFRQGSPGAQPGGGCLDTLLPFVPMCSHQEERGSESGKAARSGRQGPSQFPASLQTWHRPPGTWGSPRTCDVTVAGTRAMAASAFTTHRATKRRWRDLGLSAPVCGGGGPALQSRGGSLRTPGGRRPPARPCNFPGDAEDVVTPRHSALPVLSLPLEPTNFPSITSKSQGDGKTRWT